MNDHEHDTATYTTTTKELVKVAQMGLKELEQLLLAPQLSSSVRSAIAANIVALWHESTFNAVVTAELASSEETP